MIKIAVTISGLVRYWEVTSKLFEYWNSLYDDIEFIFFLSTWKDNNVFHFKDKVKSGLLEHNDFSECKFLTAYEQIDYNEIPIKILEEHPNNPTPFYAYALYKVQKLRRKYQNEYNFTGVIQTRNDIFIAKSTLDSIREMCLADKKKMLVPEMFFTTTGNSVIMGETRNRLNMPNDNFSFSHPLAMDKYAEMYHDSFISGENKETFHHFINAEQLMNKKIYNYRMDGKNPTPLIRVDSLKKDGWPTDDQLKQIIETKGIEFLYNSSFDKLRKEYFIHEKLVT